MQRFGAKDLTVTFGEVDVVSGVSLELRAGEIHALVGENGAGKSSVAKVLAGVYRPRLGTVYRDGESLQLSSPRVALAQRIALIHQEPLALPDLTVAESIFVGQQPVRGGRIDWKHMESETRRLLDQLGVQLDPRRLVGGLSIAQQQQVELAHALAHSAEVWIFDETTAPLTPKEKDDLFSAMNQLRSHGCAILMVTHHLDEVFRVSDRITVLRDGRMVAEFATGETNEDQVVGAMVGRELANEHFQGRGSHGVLLRVEALSGPGFRDVSLEVGAGEIVGIAGLVGAGRTEFARALFGVSRATAGRVTFSGREVRIRSPRQAMAHGFAMVPEDRRQDGLLMPQSVLVNTTLPSLQGWWLRSRELRESTAAMGARTRLVSRGVSQPVGELSGGNQQKVVLGKWLLTAPKLLILDEPTRGVDVGAKHEVHKMIRSLADEGVGVVLISSDLTEILALSERIAVMRAGTIVRTMDRSEATQESIMEAAVA